MNWIKARKCLGTASEFSVIVYWMIHSSDDQWSDRAMGFVSEARETGTTEYMISTCDLAARQNGWLNVGIKGGKSKLDLPSDFMEIAG